MRVLEVVALGGFLAAVWAVLRAALRQGAAAADRWEPGHRYENGVRRVYLCRGRELEPVGEVATGDPEYEETFLRLMARARERAAVLNSER